MRGKIQCQERSEISQARAQEEKEEDKEKWARREHCDMIERAEFILCDADDLELRDDNIAYL